MFLPYVGPAVAFASIANQTLKMSSILGKMLVGSDTPVLNNVEAWSDSFNRQLSKTEYAKQHPWCWENMIGLIGDVAG